MLNPIQTPIHISPDPIHKTPLMRVEPGQPQIILFNDTKYEPPKEPEQCYNLRSHSKHIVQSAITLTRKTLAQKYQVSAELTLKLETHWSTANSLVN